MKNGIAYRGVFLMPGSRAHLLHTEGKAKELEAHMREVEAAYNRAYVSPQVRPDSKG